MPDLFSFSQFTWRYSGGHQIKLVEKGNNKGEMLLAKRERC